MKHARDDYNTIIDTSGKIPEDEPVFLIRGQDLNASKVVRFWATLAEGSGAEPDIIEAATEHAYLMDKWPNKKIPDMQQQTEEKSYTALLPSRSVISTLVVVKGSKKSTKIHSSRDFSYSENKVCNMFTQVLYTDTFTLSELRGVIRLNCILVGFSTVEEFKEQYPEEFSSILNSLTTLGGIMFPIPFPES